MSGLTPRLDHRVRHDGTVSTEVINRRRNVIGREPEESAIARLLAEDTGGR